MARHRSRSKGSSAKSGPRPVSKGDASLARWNTREDIQNDSEDDFHEQRDSIMIDEGRRRRGRQQDDSEEEDAEEVYALEGMDQSSDEDELDELDEGEMREDEDDEEEDVVPSKGKKGKAATVASDNEAESDEEDERLASWGTKKSAYYAKDDEIESSGSEAEEDRKLEEEEALRIQRRGREDWGWDDVGAVAADGLEDAEEEDKPAEEKKKDKVDLTGLSKHELLAHIQKVSPETLALVREYEDVLGQIEDGEAAIAKKTAEDPQHPSLGLLHLHHQTLLTYAPLLTFYLYLRASPAYASEPWRLSSHPLMKRLLKLKEGLAAMEDLGFDGAEEDEEDEADASEDELALQKRDMLGLWAGEHGADDDEWEREGLEDGELDELLDEGLLDDDEEPLARPKSKKRKAAAAGVDGEKKKKKKAKKGAAFGPQALELEEPEFIPSSTSALRQPTASTSAFDDAAAYTDPSALSALDASAKATAKKSLRFHTARLARASNRRANAARERAGGDDDIPYRERKKEKTVKSAKGEALDSEAGWTGADEQARREVLGEEGGEEGEEGYYDLVRKSKKERQDAKKAVHDRLREESRIDYVDPDDESSGGPRGLPRHIAQNKTLERSRSRKSAKANRNPRVKKRMRFEKAQKKLGSIKALYKGGPEGGRYEGEKSGIGRNVRSVKLG